MSKITLTEVYLLNWYGFQDKTIHLGDNFSLITGENECGKSTVLDAIKYAFTGDTEFNKATSATRVGVGRRTLASYTRCLVDPDTGKYARSSTTDPNVYTHIALQYHNELYDTNFVLGVILETNSSDHVENYWYACENKTLSQLSFFNEKEKKKYALSAKQFRDKNQIELLTKNNGIVKFMTMTGLKLQGEGVTKYQRKLRSIMTYNPEAKIQQFIKESVLEEKHINLNKLKEAKDSIDEITISFELLEKEIHELDNILQAFHDYVRVNSRLIKDDAKKVYKDLLATTQQLNHNTKRINENRFEIARLTDLLNAETTERNQKDIDLRNANRQLDQMDGTRAIQDEKEKLSELKTKAEETSVKVHALKELTQRILEFSKQMSMSFQLSDLCDPNIASSVKNNELTVIQEQVDQYLEELRRKDFQLEIDLQAIQKQLTELDEVIQACERNLPDYSKVSAQLGLIKEINQQFKVLNIQSEAKFANSFVIELKNEEWRNATETFLGIHRYSILVEPEYFALANEVMNHSRYKYVELVNTPLLSRKEFIVEEDSLFHQLKIQNEIAKKYFAYWLGRIHAVSLEEVPNYENAIAKEGKISRNMAVSFLNFNKLDSYCLGEDAIQLNKARALKEKRRLENQERELSEEKYINASKMTSTKVLNQWIHKEVDLEAPNTYSMIRILITECENRIRKLEEALKNNSEYLLLVERIAEIEEKLQVLSDSIDEHRQRKMQYENENNILSESNVQLRIKVKADQDELDRLSLNYPNEVKDAQSAFDQFIEGKKESGDVMIESTRIRALNERKSCERSIIEQQSVYNTVKHIEEALPVGLEYEAEYRKRKNRLQVDNFEEIKTKLAVQTNKYESIFKNEFVLKIKTNIEEAQADIKEINKQLKKLRFSTTYQFDVKEISGVSDYAKILEYANYLKKTNRIDDHQMMLGSVIGYDENEAAKREEEIKTIVNRILAKNNDELLNDFADYRNYMEYEVIVNNDEITNGRLSKLAGYNSGAGTQIPYTIILSAALAIIYNARQNSTRLVFIDEPFEKMSDKNIKIMLDFFKMQEFQVIFCAPPNKMDSIGKECDVIIPIQKINKSNMTLGEIIFHE